VAAEAAPVAAGAAVAADTAADPTAFGAPLAVVDPAVGAATGALPPRSVCALTVNSRIHVPQSKCRYDHSCQFDESKEDHTYSLRGTMHRGT